MHKHADRARAGRPGTHHATAYLLASLGLTLLSAAPARTQTTPAETWLAALQPDAAVASFRSTSLYLGASESPTGARFTHAPSGMPVDLLVFDSVPQAMVWIRTLPDSDRGEPHTAEHLVLGKGRKGRLLQLSFDMSMGSSSAYTARSHTVYHFHTAGGRQSFLDLLYRQLDALLHPDFTDEEIRREVAHLGIVEEEDGARLGLEEKGTIYLEMVSSFEKPGQVIWHTARRLTYGATHPLGLESGGLPEAIRTMEPEHLRAFLDRCYRPGEGFGLIIALPSQYDLERFLGDLDGLLRKVCNGYLAEPPGNDGRPRLAAGSTPGGDPLRHLPPFEPPEKPEVHRLPFPSASANASSAAVLTWAPYDSMSTADLYRLRLLWYLVAGDETSYFYKDLVDGTTRRVGPGIASVGGWIYGDPGHPPMAWLGGLEAPMQTQASLEEIRAVVGERLAWLAALEPDAPEIEELNRRARTYLVATRRELIEQTDRPPRFGYRGTGGFWYEHLYLLSAEPGFRKDLLRDGIRRQIEQEMEDPGFWPRLVRRFDLGVPRLVICVYPDTALPAALEAAKAERLAAGLARLGRELGLEDAQETLRRYRAEFEAATAELDVLERDIARPGFLTDPPLTLDDLIDTQVEALVVTTQGGAQRELPVCVNRFARTLTLDFGLYYDVTGTPAEALPYLALLPSVFTDLGCRNDQGDWLAYDRLQQRLQEEVSSVRTQYSTTPCEGGCRVELAAYATGLGVEEGRRALTWAVRLLQSAAALDSAALPRLRDVVEREIASLRQRPQGAEESWADNPADAYRFQRDWVYLSAASLFTRIHHLERIRWRLLEPPPDMEIAALANHLNDFLETWDGARAGLWEELARMADPASGLPAITATLTDYLRTELEHAPDETLREDLLLLYGQALDDLMVAPTKVLADLRAMVGGLLEQGLSRAHVTGSYAQVDSVRPALDVAVARLADFAESSAAPPASWDAAADPQTVRRPGRGALSPGVITTNLRARYDWLDNAPGARAPYAALLHEATRNALFNHTVRLANYAPVRRGKLLDYLASKLYGGAGAHGLFMKTWGAGLAYSNGVGSNPRSGFASYYAERCGDGVETLRFVTGLLNDADRTIDSPFFLDYALANCFGDYRAGDTYVRRGRAMARDLADGITPDQVRRFKEGLLQLREEWEDRYTALHAPVESPGADNGLLADVRGRLPDVLGPLLPGYGKRASEDWGSVNLMIAPSTQVEAYEVYLRDREPDARLVRLYPRDFWIP